MQYSQMSNHLILLHKPFSVLALDAKMKVLARLKIPSSGGTGKGSRKNYSQQDFWEIHLALSLMEFGIKPEEIELFFKTIVHPLNLYHMQLHSIEEEFVMAIHFYKRLGAYNENQEPLIHHFLKNHLHTMFDQFPFQSGGLIVDITRITRNSVKVFGNLPEHLC